MKALEEGRHIACEGMTRGKLEVGIEDIAERLDQGMKTTPLVLRDPVRLRVGVNRTGVLYGC